MKKGICLLILALLTYSCYSQGIKTFEARNGVDFAYTVILPEGYQKNKSYELAMVFTEIETEDKGFEQTLAVLNKLKGLNNMILFIPKVPTDKPHWISHPIHHGLNDFMKNMRDDYGSKSQKFHFIGHLKGGRVAQTYSGMSSEYVASLSFANSTHWPITKQEYFDDIFNKGFKVYVYSSEPAESLAIDVSNTTFNQVKDFEKAILTIDRKVRNY
ncbi:MAG: hypothetical protein Roseis2KO_32630 [Roseivirga sp.]